MTRNLLDAIVEAVATGGDVNFIFLDDTCPEPSRYRYVTGCRCQGCTAAHTAYNRRYRARTARR